MASPAQIAANRRNAQKSTGPKSAAGKARSSQNAFRHGYSQGVTVDPSAHEKEMQALRAMGLSEEEVHRVIEAQAIACKLAEERRELLRRMAFPHPSMLPLRPGILDATYRYEERARKRKQRLMRGWLGRNVIGTKKRSSAKRSQSQA